MSTWERLASLPLRIEDYALEGLSESVSSDFERLSTVIRLRGGGQEGLGEDVTYDGVDQEILQARRTAAAARGQLHARRASASSWPASTCSRRPPSVRSRVAIACGRMSRRRSISRCARPA